MRKIIGAVMAVALVTQTSAATAQSANYVVVGMHLDQVMQPKNEFDVAADCNNNMLCKGALAAISSATGYPIDKAVAVAALLSVQNFGEGNGFNIGLPNGYRYCSASFKLTSIVPHDGDRGSRILLRADDTGLYAETWTPKMPIGQGRSWVEGDVEVVGIRADLAEAAYAGGTACHRGDSRGFFWCRGGGCEGQIADKGRSVSFAGDPPGAGQRRE